jgi:hypothetical protein
MRSRTPNAWTTGRRWRGPVSGSPRRRSSPCTPRPPCASATGRLSITDGPFAETKEQLAGFYLIEADDLDAAIRIAAGIPPARVGSIEVRPVRELDP